MTGFGKYLNRFVQEIIQGRIELSSSPPTFLQKRNDKQAKLTHIVECDELIYEQRHHVSSFLRIPSTIALMDKFSFEILTDFCMLNKPTSFTYTFVQLLPQQPKFDKAERQILVSFCPSIHFAILQNEKKASFLP
jgi:hypothetical protein